MIAELNKGAQFVARPVLWRNALYVAGSLAFVVVGGWIAGLIGDPPGNAPAWIGWISILFFGACGIGWALRMFDTEDVLRIDDTGLWYRYHSRETIPFAAIASIGTWSFQGQKAVFIQLRNPDDYPATGASRHLAALNRGVADADVSISMNGLDKSFDEIMSALDARIG